MCFSIFSRRSPSKPPNFSHCRPPTLGLRRIHALTTQATYELHVDLEDFENGTAYAHYGSFGVGLFSVDPEEDGYPLTVADYSGTAGKAPGHSRKWGAGRPPTFPPGRTEEVLPGPTLHPSESRTRSRSGSGLPVSTPRYNVVLTSAM